MDNMTQWFAGLIDGEGCFTFDIYSKKRGIAIVPVFMIAMSPVIGNSR